MKLFLYINKTALYLAVENEYIEIVKNLLLNPKIDINIPFILIYAFFISFDNLFILILFKL